MPDLQANNSTLELLLIHTYYQEKGGEDGVFEQECKLLSEFNQVDAYTAKNQSGFKGAIQFMSSLWNPVVIYRLKKKIRASKPSLVHIHNWHFALGPVIIRTAKKCKIPVVVTLHNYRLICPSASLMHGNQLFTDSIHEYFPWTAVRKKVYRSSYLQTFWLASLLWFHKKIGTWQMVDRYIALTPFAKNLFLSSTLSLKESQITVKPNFVQGQTFQQQERTSFLFAGRFTEEKGIRVLLKAFSTMHADIAIAGAGPLLNEVHEAASKFTNIKYLGNLNKAAMQEAMRNCDALIFPSIWYEGMPMTILEAFSAGTPVIASKIGAMESMIENGHNGLLFEAGEVTDLIKKIELWQSFPENEIRLFRQNAVNSFQKYYTSEKNREQLQSIYNDVLLENR